MNISRTPDRPYTRDARPVRILLIGDGLRPTFGHRADVEQIMAQLCTLRFCDHAEWSKILPQPKRGDFMSVMTKWRSD